MTWLHVPFSEIVLLASWVALSVQWPCTLRVTEVRLPATPDCTVFLLPLLVMLNGNAGVYVPPPVDEPFLVTVSVRLKSLVIVHVIEYVPFD